MSKTMNFRLCFLLGLIVMSPTLVISQNISFEPTFHPDFLYEERAVPTEIIGSAGNKHYLLYSKGKHGFGQSTIVEFSPDFTPTGKSLDMFDPNDDVKQHTLGSILVDGEIGLIMVRSTKESRSFSLHVVDLENLRVTKIKDIADVKIENKNSKRILSTVMVSQDTSAIGIIYTKPKNKIEEFFVSVFDRKFNPLADWSFTLPPYNEGLFVQQAHLIDSSKMVLLMANKEEPSYENSIRLTPNHNYRILTLENGKVVNDVNLPNDDKWLDNPKLHITDSSYTVVGIYSERKRYHAAGTFIHTISLDNQVLLHSFIPLSENSIKQNVRSKSGQFGFKKLSKFNEIPYYVLNMVYVNANDTYTLIAEQIHTVSQYVTSYFYENLLLINLGFDGVVNWEKTINKTNGHGSTWIYSSYYSTLINDDLVLVYNGNSQNMARPSDIRFNAFSSTFGQSIMLASINPEGSVTQSVLVKEQDLDGFTIRPSLSARNSLNHLIFFSQVRNNVKRQRFLSVDVEGSNH